MKFPALAILLATSGVVLGHGALSFAQDQGKWWTDREYNNCYNFATDVKTNTYAHPGRGSGRKFEIFACEDRDGQLGLVHAAQNDGLIHVKSPDQCSRGQEVAALAVAESDYHWYRRIDKTGLWMHKMGGLEPTDRDHSGRVIYDVEKADRDWFTTFCGYFCVGKGVRIE